MWCTQVRSVGDGHRVSICCSCRERTGRFYQIRNESRVGTPVVKVLHWQFHSWCSCKILPPKVLWKAPKNDKKEPGLFKEEFTCTKMLYLCSKTCCCYDISTKNYHLRSKDLNKFVLKQNSYWSSEKDRRVLVENSNYTSTSRSFWTNNHVVATNN